MTVESPSSADAPPTGPLAALKFPAFRLLWAGTLAASLAQQMQWVASGFLVYDLTNSPVQLGLNGLFRALPLILFSLVGGALADTVDRRKLLLISQSAAMLLAAGLAGIAATNGLHVYHLYAATFLISTTNALFNPTRAALAPQLVPPAVLMNAVTFSTVAQQASMFVGPALAGLALAAWGGPGAFGLCALGFALSVAASFGLPGGKAAAGPSRRDGKWESAAGGARFVAQRPTVLALLAMDFGVTFLAGYRTIMPVFAKDVLGVGPEGLGLLSAAPGVGALIGSAGIIALGDIQRKGIFVMAVTAVFALTVVGFSALAWFPASLALAAILGCLDSMAVTTRNTIILLTTPDELRGRVQSVVQIVVQGSPALAGLQIGTLAALIGPQPALALGGVLCLSLVGTISMRVADLRRA